MEPTFPSGCRLWANAWSYLVEAPARGDVVIVVSPEQPSRIEVKRVVGLPNEAVEWNGGRIWVEGLPLEEPYAWIRESPPGDEPCPKTRLGAKEYFVAGDNRLYSRDSRHFGPVPRSAVLARVDEPVGGLRKLMAGEAALTKLGENAGNASGATSS